MEKIQFDDVQRAEVLPAFKEPGTNALVHDPFAWGEAAPEA